MAELPVSYLMENKINGAAVKISGNGTLSETGLLVLDLSLSSYPQDWNAIVVPCICSGPGPGPTPRGMIALAPSGYRTEPGTHRNAILWDETGKEIAKVKATGVYKRVPTGLDFGIRVATKIFVPGILPTLSRIGHYSFTILPRAKGTVNVFAHYSLEDDGGKKKVYGCTRIAYKLIDSKYVSAQVG